ncbi:MAG: allophanate hydrolase [Cyanobacteria bacterium J06642_2]
MLLSELVLDIRTLRYRYEHSDLTPSSLLVERLYPKISSAEAKGVWTYLVPKPDLLQRAAELERQSPETRQQLPLWGIPFSVKDCIDIANLPTSCACDRFTYTAEATNPVVQALLDAGAILIGKTNLDQFATGVVGVRTDFGIPRNPFNADYIPGGSSSGAAVSVARQFVSFAIGTDTGGSGRVPAALNNVVGLKPTRGLLSTRHTIPACRTLDCISIFALNVADAAEVFEVAQGFDPLDPFSRQAPPAEADKAIDAFTFGVPAEEFLQFHGNQDVEARFREAIARLIDLGGICKTIDYAPLLEATNLLFKGTWIAERYASVGRFVEENPEAVHPAVRTAVLNSKSLSAVQVFEDQYKLANIRRAIAPMWEAIDVLVVPTIGTTYTIAEVEANPIDLNLKLGYYTNFVNLLDLAAVAIPYGFQSNGVPCGISLIGRAFSEPYLIQLGAKFTN